MTDDSIRDATAALGMMLALQTTVRALIVTHPNAAGLVDAFQRQHDETMEMLARRGIPLDAIEAYKDFLYLFMPVDVKIESSTEAQAVDTSGRVLH